MATPVNFRFVYLGTRKAKQSEWIKSFMGGFMEWTDNKETHNVHAVYRVEIEDASRSV